MKKNNTLKKKLETVLDKPGVYKMLDEKGNILYIGKSIALKKRIQSYLVKEIKRNDKVRHMVKRIKDIEVYYTDTELDALLLECLWIRQYKPPYNTALMHPEKYSYFVVKEHNKCTLKWSKSRDDKADLLIGPITHKSLARGAYAYFKTQYLYAFCDRKIDYCMEYLTGKCEGYCKAASMPSLIEAMISDLENIKATENRLTKVMESLCDQWEFEKASAVYEQIRGLKYLSRLYQMMNCIEKETYIERMPIPDTFDYKYYLVRGGKVVATRKGIRTEEKAILKDLRKRARSKQQPAVEVLKEEIDAIKIIYSFKHKKMKVFAV